MGAKRPIKVLVVEDNEATRMLHRAFLETLDGVEVCGEACGGAEGLEQVRACHPDLVLLDLAMPGMNGTALLLALKDDPPPTVPKVIVISHLCHDAVVRYAADMGAVAYLVKPIHYAELEGLIRRCFDGEAPSDETELVVARARWLLERMGAPPDSLGCRYAALTAGELARDRDQSMLLKVAYCPAMRAGKTSQANVEKNIRVLIARLHAMASAGYTAMMGGMPGRRPDNRTFLHRLAEAARGGTEE